MSDYAALHPVKVDFLLTHPCLPLCQRHQPGQPVGGRPVAPPLGQQGHPSLLLHMGHDHSQQESNSVTSRAAAGLSGCSVAILAF